MKYRLWIAAGALVVIGLAALWWLGLPPFSAPTGREGRAQRAPVQATTVEVELTEKQVNSLKTQKRQLVGLEP